jgi:membrane protease YdiL (CAAX protease family)
MASTSTQPELAIAPQPEVPAVSNAQRWTDLGLVLLVAFATSVAGSISLAFHPGPIQYSNMRLALGLLDEAVALLLFFVLFKRQGRQLRSIGFGFQWTDLPKAAGLVAVAFTVMGLMVATVHYAYFLITQRTFHDNGPHSGFSGSSLALILPFIILNGLFEETLVRGYLMTEFIDLRGSVVLATVISLGLQTSYHLYYGIYGAAMVGCGLSVLAIYYAKSRRLMPVILAHMLWDFITVLSKLQHS